MMQFGQSFNSAQIHFKQYCNHSINTFFSSCFTDATNPDVYMLKCRYWLYNIPRCRFVVLQVIRLRFTNFDVDRMYDTVSVFDGTNTTALKLGEYSGQTIPSEVISTTEYLFVDFKSDITTTMRGFELIYEATDLCK